MTTFSQLIDAMVLETKRADLRTEMSSYLNQTLRELHFDPERGGAHLFRDNLTETLITSAVESGLTWDIPSPQNFQAMLAVEYQSMMTNQGDRVFAVERLPGRGVTNEDYWFYRAGVTYAFTGNGGIGSLVALAYYEYPRNLKYYAAAVRPATYDQDLGWTYAAEFDTSDELRLAARNFVTNWLLMRWGDVITEGLRAKIYKRVSDTERARTCYSLYSTLRKGLVSSESADLSGYS